MNNPTPGKQEALKMAENHVQKPGMGTVTPARAESHCPDTYEVDPNEPDDAPPCRAPGGPAHRCGGYADGRPHGRYPFPHWCECGVEWLAPAVGWVADHA